mmetsp:Transcript_93769/g.270184  ORF Transcript_93769/g.270184 Transcript_93769/m.270184 type:complete len:212 (+) Transcript_93769:910-1545(+)
MYAWNAASTKRMETTPLSSANPAQAFSQGAAAASKHRTAAVMSPAMDQARPASAQCGATMACSSVFVPDCAPVHASAKIAQAASRNLASFAMASGAVLSAAQTCHKRWPKLLSTTKSLSAKPTDPSRANISRPSTSSSSGSRPDKQASSILMTCLRAAPSKSPVPAGGCCGKDSSGCMSTIAASMSEAGQLHVLEQCERATAAAVEIRRAG